MQIFCVFDTAAGVFGRPFFTASSGTAVRGFTDEVNRVDRDNPMNGHPEDFQLWHIGAFDDHTGKTEMVPEGPLRVVTAKEVFISKEKL